MSTVVALPTSSDETLWQGCTDERVNQSVVSACMGAQKRLVTYK